MCDTLLETVSARHECESAGMLEQPREFIGNILAVLTSTPLARRDFRAAVTKWKMVESEHV
jgi:hypothetical protein